MALFSAALSLTYHLAPFVLKRKYPSVSLEALTTTFTQMTLRSSSLSTHSYRKNVISQNNLTLRHRIVCIYIYIYIYRVAQKKRPEVCVTIMACVLYLEKFPFAHMYISKSCYHFYKFQ